MKKIIITIVCILLFALILTITIVNFSSLGHNKDLEKAKNAFLKGNKNSNIENITSYYGDKAYYILSFKKDNKDFISVMDNNYTIILTIEKNELYNLKDNSTLGYRDNKLVYEVKESTKDGFVYSYYDALTGEFIKNIKLTK